MLDIHNNLKEVEFLISSVQNGSYAGIFLISILVSFIIPLPEAVALLIFGFLGAETELDISKIFAVTFLGLIVGNNIVYRLTFVGSKWVARFNRKMREHKLIRYEHLVSDNIYKAIYFLRLIAGVRFFGPVISGSLRAPWKKYFLGDFGATFLNTAIFVFLGYFFHDKIIPLIAEVEIVRNVLLFFSAIIVGFLVSVFSREK